MDFDDHDEADDEIKMHVGSGYENPMGNNSSRTGAVTGGAKLGAGFGSGGTEAAAATTTTGTGNRRVSSGTGGGKYRECLKNHAVGIGGHAVDGCGEFMATGEEGTLDALQCAACSCHRNFHRKETTERGDGAGVMPLDAVGYHPQFSPYYRTPAAYLHAHHYMSASAAHHQHLRPNAPLALPSTSGGGVGGHSIRDEQDDVSDHMMAMGIGGSGGLGMGMSGGIGASGSGSGKKRFRTKFTQEQKDKMLALAERIGWRIQKHDEAAVQQFCNETGVKRHVLKVWMHNNKHTLGKKL